jgi:hypothetical protein
MIAREKDTTSGLGRVGAVNAALPLMLATIVSVGVFLVWLNKASEPAPVELVEQVVEESGEMGPMATEVALAAYAADPGSFAGSLIKVAGVIISAFPTGTEGLFWVQEGGLLLFHLEDGLVAAEAPLAMGETLVVTGTVAALGPDVLNAWVASGRAPEDARMELGFANEYFAVQSVERAGAPGTPGSGG